MLSRRSFMSLTTAAAWQSPRSAHGQALPDCEWCGASEAPGNLTSAITLAGRNEPGERLHLQGTVYAPDGVTPVPGCCCTSITRTTRGCMRNAAVKRETAAATAIYAAG